MPESRKGTSNSYFGKIASLISKASIRYEGTISDIDNEQITLHNVRIFGTEDRECEVFVEILRETRPLISFSRDGIQSIRIIPQYTFFDPSILNQEMSPSDFRPTEREVGYQRYQRNPRQYRRRYNPKYNKNVYNKKHPDDYKNEEEVITENFDFEESNKKFDKVGENIDNAAPVYIKEEFYDEFQDIEDKEGWNDRELDEETFGKGTVRKYENEHRFRQFRKNYCPYHTSRGKR